MQFCLFFFIPAHEFCLFLLILLLILLGEGEELESDHFVLSCQLGLNHNKV